MSGPRGETGDERPPRGEAPVGHGQPGEGQPGEGQPGSWSGSSVPQAPRDRVTLELGITLSERMSPQGVNLRGPRRGGCVLVRDPRSLQWAHAPGRAGVHDGAVDTGASVPLPPPTPPAAACGERTGAHRGTRGKARGASGGSEALHSLEAAQATSRAADTRGE